MVIKKHKPSLDGVLKRRRLSVAQYFGDLGVTTQEQLVTVLEALIGSFRVSESLQEEAFAWVTTLRKPEAILQKEEDEAEVQALKPEEEKPKRPPKRSTGKKKKASTKEPETDSEE